MNDGQTPRLIAGSRYVTFDGMIWPAAGSAVAHLEWTLRYGEPTREDILVAASVLAAYRDLVETTKKRRDGIVRILKEFK